ncbi:MAG: hypothetical protein AAGU76_14815 [Sedimentibacter sp.]|uniref:hypothetical protein n=1 Tax=Sedimentibacter sp. TaxID=1960295 RepID=UPI003158A24E
MEKKLLLEAFLLKAKTADGFGVIIGGFCPAEMKDEAVKSYSDIGVMNLGQFKDVFLIDYALAEAVRLLSPEYIKIAGASIRVEGAKSSTGGVLGNPFDEHDSAQEEIEEPLPGIYMLTVSGGPGIAFSGTFQEAVRLKEMIAHEKKKGKFKMKNLVKQLDSVSNLYIAVSDGSGSSDDGGIYISGLSGKQCEAFN